MANDIKISELPNIISIENDDTLIINDATNDLTYKVNWRDLKNSIGTISNGIVFPLGSIEEPSVAIGDLSSGIYAQDYGRFGIVTQGDLRLDINQAGTTHIQNGHIVLGNIDRACYYRLDVYNTSTFHCDATFNSISINGDLGVLGNVILGGDCDNSVIINGSFVSECESIFREDVIFESDLTVKGDLEVDGNTTIGKNCNTFLDINSQTNIKCDTLIDGNLVVSGPDFIVNGDNIIIGNDDCDTTSLVLNGAVDITCGLDIDGDLVVDGNIDINGELINLGKPGEGCIPGNEININGSSNTECDSNVGGDINIDGNTNIGGNIEIDGNGGIGGDLVVDGNLNVNGENISIGDPTKPCVPGTTIDLNGNVNTSCDMQIDGNITILGDSIAIGDPTAPCVPGNSIDLYGNVEITCNLVVDGTTTLKDDLDVTGDTTLIGDFDVTGDSTLTGKLDVIGDSTLTGKLDVTGDTTLIGDFDVTGDSTLTGKLDVTGDSTLTGKLDVTGDSTITGDTLLDGNVQIGTNNCTENLLINNETDIKCTTKIGDDIILEPGSGSITANFFIGDGSGLVNMTEGLRFRGDIDPSVDPGTLDPLKNGDFWVCLESADGSYVVDTFFNGAANQPYSLSQILYYKTTDTGSSYILGSIQDSQGFVTINTQQQINGQKTFSDDVIGLKTATFIDRGEFGGITNNEDLLNEGDGLFKENVDIKKLTTLGTNCSTRALLVQGKAQFDCDVNIDGNLTLPPGGDLSVGNDLYVGGNVTIDGDLTALGDIVLGDDCDTDTLKITAETDIFCVTRLWETLQVRDQVTIGGPDIDNPLILLNADGSAEFAGGNGVNMPESFGIQTDGSFCVRKDSGGDIVHSVYKSGPNDSNVTKQVLANGTTYIGGSIPSSPNIELNPNGTGTYSGDVIPKTDGGSSLGSTTNRWANVYTNDMHFSNEGTEGNCVDGTTGNWTLQEGEDNLYLINNKTGMKFKISMEPVG